MVLAGNGCRSLNKCPKPPSKKDIMPLLPPCLAWRSEVWNTQVSAPWGSTIFGSTPAQHTLATYQCLHTQGLNPDIAQPHASSQDNLETKVGQ